MTTLTAGELHEIGLAEELFGLFCSAAGLAAVAEAIAEAASRMGSEDWNDLGRTVRALLDVGVEEEEDFFVVDFDELTKE